jgi:hypothetical protein
MAAFGFAINGQARHRVIVRQVGCSPSRTANAAATERQEKMPHADLEQMIIASAVAGRRDLIEQDRQCGGNGKLTDTAISMTRQRTMITLHCNYSEDARTLSAGFVLPEPLPDAKNANGDFLLELDEWLEGRQPAPELFALDQQRDTLH